ncbi:MAG: Pr6Pr family membrane protein [Chitinophagaceae bacterium]|nr:Pr6Pr family membrane protein [Chitinophagaceae bacterium]
MKRNISILIAFIAWTAVSTQYYLMLQNRVTSISETTIRFFSFFTILTNLLVAVYFTAGMVKQKGRYLSILDQPGTLTSVTIYITVVGLVYQVVLRHTWNPTGLQKIADELLHSVIPVVVIFFWYLYEHKSLVKFRQIPQWLLYPLLYLIYILIRGSFSGFYPYPFVNVINIGLQKVLINCVILTVLFIGISAIFIKAGRWIKA